MLGIGHADKNIARKTQRLDDALAQKIPIIHAAGDFDQRRRHPQRGASVILQARAGCPFECEVAHLFFQFLVIRPHRWRDVLAGKPRAVAQHLRDGDVALTVLREIRHVLGDAIAKRQQAVFHQRPHAHGGDDFGVGKQQPQRVVLRGLVGFNVGLTEGFKQRQLPVPRQRDLRAGIAALGDVFLNHAAQLVQRGHMKAQFDEV